MAGFANDAAKRRRVYANARNNQRGPCGHRPSKRGHRSPPQAHSNGRHSAMPCYAMLLYAASLRARLAYGIWPYIGTSRALPRYYEMALKREALASITEAHMALKRRTYRGTIACGAGGRRHDGLWLGDLARPPTVHRRHAQRRSRIRPTGTQFRVSV